MVEPALIPVIVPVAETCATVVSALAQEILASAPAGMKDTVGVYASATRSVII